MVRLPLPAIVIIGVLVVLAAKMMLVLPPPGIRAFTESMSLVLELENKGDSDNEREFLAANPSLADNWAPLRGMDEGDF